MERLIQADGQPCYGLFPHSPALINYRDFDFRSPMGRRLGALAKWRRFHQFQYFGLMGEQLIGGCALAHLSLVSIAFVYLYHPPSGRLLERRFKAPLGLGSRFSQAPDDGVCTFRRGRNHLRLENRAGEGLRRVRVELDDGLVLDASFREAAEEGEEGEAVRPFQPLCICTPVASTGWTFARKVAGVRCQGEVSGPLGRFDLAALDTFAHHDWSAGFMRPETCWRWACLSGWADGRRVGLNLACGVNETSFTENCFWLDGELVKVDSVAFRFDRDDPLQPWTITSFDGQVELTFQGVGLHRERLDLLIMASHFRQVFGRFHGTLRPRGRPPISIDGLWGFVEDHYAKW